MVFNKIWMNQIFCYSELYGSKIFIFVHFNVYALANIHLLQIFIDLKTVFISEGNRYFSEENSHITCRC